MTILKTTYIIHKGVETNTLKITTKWNNIFSQKRTAHSFHLIKDKRIFHSKTTGGHAVYTIKFEGGASIITIM